MTSVSITDSERWQFVVGPWMRSTTEPEHFSEAGNSPQDWDTDLRLAPPATLGVWRGRMHEADAEIREGNVAQFDTIDDLLSDLDRAD